MNNFKKFVSAFSAVILASSVISSPAMATSPASGTYQGAATAFKGITVNCDTTVKLDWTNAKGQMDLHTGANCDALKFVEYKGGPDNHWYDITWDGTNHQVVFQDVYVETVTLGDCATAELRMDVDHSPDTLLIDAILPPATGTLQCVVEGYASLP